MLVTLAIVAILHYLEEFDLNNTGKEPPNKNTLDVSSISFDINTSYKNTFNLNSRDLSNINTINIFFQLIH